MYKPNLYIASLRTTQRSFDFWFTEFKRFVHSGNKLK